MIPSSTRERIRKEGRKAGFARFSPERQTSCREDYASPPTWMFVVNIYGNLNLRVLTKVNVIASVRDWAYTKMCEIRVCRLVAFDFLFEFLFRFFLERAGNVI